MAIEARRAPTVAEGLGPPLVADVDGPLASDQPSTRVADVEGLGAPAFVAVADRIAGPRPTRKALSSVCGRECTLVGRMGAGRRLTTTFARRART